MTNCALHAAHCASGGGARGERRKGVICRAVRAASLLSPVCPQRLWTWRDHMPSSLARLGSAARRRFTSCADRRRLHRPSGNRITAT
eukprot:gene3784-biopygen34935